MAAERLATATAREQVTSLENTVRVLEVRLQVAGAADASAQAEAEALRVKDKTFLALLAAGVADDSKRVTLLEDRLQRIAVHYGGNIELDLLDLNCAANMVPMEARLQVLCEEVRDLRVQLSDLALENLREQLLELEDGEDEDEEERRSRALTKIPTTTSSTLGRRRRRKRRSESW